MTSSAKELMTLMPEMPSLIPKLSEDKVQEILNILVDVKQSNKNGASQRKVLAKHRRELIESRKYVRPSGRTHREIDEEIKEMRSDRF